MKDCMFEISTFMIKYKIILIISYFLNFLSQSCNIIIHNVLNLEWKKFWSITKLHSLQAKLKITYYDQQYLKSFALLIQQVLSILFLLFINNFEIYKNIYWILIFEKIVWIKSFWSIQFSSFHSEWETSYVQKKMRSRANTSLIISNSSD